MSTKTTKTYRVDVIERIPAEYRVEAEGPRAAAEGWADGDLVDRDDEALDTEGPTAVWERLPDGTWRRVPPSEWRGAGPAIGADTAAGAGADAEARAFLGTIARLKIAGEDGFVEEPDDAAEALRSLIVTARRLAGDGRRPGDPAADDHGYRGSPCLTLSLTDELADRMLNPSPDVVYSLHSFCSMADDNRAEWTHPDDQYVIAFDRRTRTFTGHYYDWDEEKQDWVDTATMTAEQIRECIERNRLIFAR